MRKVAAQEKQDVLDIETVVRMDLDSHADTCCTGLTCCVIEYMGKTCDVTPFSHEYEPMKDIPIVKAATAYMMIHKQAKHIFW